MQTPDTHLVGGYGLISQLHKIPSRTSDDTTDLEQYIPPVILSNFLPTLFPDPHRGCAMTEHIAPLSSGGAGWAVSTD
jgi:hypothetical protein